MDDKNNTQVQHELLRFSKSMVVQMRETVTDLISHKP